MNFGDALVCLKHGERVRRAGSGTWIVLHDPDALGRRAFYANMKDQGLVTWLVSHADLLAEDWELETP